ncbi:hypothetical protein Q4Q34_02835 [Flavivirga abyssicola]|uniref:hypothetical protein n=1 Tax=Flavivirga abyssicola TaxID=3063533 RepID=UPI0026E0EFCE|nr:hypothetical protein [Flavivirga sp. MEBiC07777]WVK13971.1 hypothetical protein Q4Q34_02835 [Flavivirga sp. MEBiC07777]
MGGEGSMLAAINSLKNNRSLLSKRKEKSALGGSYSNVKLAKFPKATAEQLKEIRNRTIKENRKTRIKTMLCFILFLILISTFLYLI